MEEARSYLYEGSYPDKDSQILKEIDYVKNRYELIPAAYLSYERIAYFGNEDSNFRLTFDQNILCRQCFMDLQYGSYGTQLLEAGQVLMEIKIPGTMPLWMSHILTDLEIYPVSYSKYGTYYKNYLCQNKLVNQTRTDKQSRKEGKSEDKIKIDQNIPLENENEICTGEKVRLENENTIYTGGKICA